MDRGPAERGYGRYGIDQRVGGVKLGDVSTAVGVRAASAQVPGALAVTQYARLLIRAPVFIPSWSACNSPCAAAGTLTRDDLLGRILVFGTGR